MSDQTNEPVDNTEETPLVPEATTEGKTLGTDDVAPATDTPETELNTPIDPTPEVIQPDVVPEATEPVNIESAADVKVEPSVIPLEDIKIQKANLLDKDDPAKATDLKQVSVEGIEQEKVPNMAEVDKSAKKADITRIGEDKEKDASLEENPGVSRDMQIINPEIITGRKSEYPRG